MQKFGMSRRSMLVAAFFIATLPLAPAARAQQAAQDGLIGKWQADDGSVKLDMFRAGDEFQARLLYGNQVMEADNVTFQQDANNPDPTLRHRSLQNIVFIRGLRWTDGEWTGGSLYDGSSGKTYRCKAEIRDGKMLLRGYLGISLLGQTREFHRVSD